MTIAKHYTVVIFGGDGCFQWMRTKHDGSMFLGVIFTKNQMVILAWLYDIGIYDFMQNKL